MPSRQTVPRQWLVADRRLGKDLWNAVRQLPAGSGVLFLYRDLANGQRARLLSKLRRVARGRRLLVVDEAAGQAARVHDVRQLRRAALAGAPYIFLSPVYPTQSHPQWAPLSRMKASTLAHLSPVPVVALGGMNARRFRTVEALGFAGWAGIGAWTASFGH